MNGSDECKKNFIENGFQILRKVEEKRAEENNNNTNSINKKRNKDIINKCNDINKTKSKRDKIIIKFKIDRNQQKIFKMLINKNRKNNYSNYYSFLISNLYKHTWHSAIVEFLNRAKFHSLALLLCN